MYCLPPSSDPVKIAPKYTERDENRKSVVTTSEPSV